MKQWAARPLSWCGLSCESCAICSKAPLSFLLAPWSWNSRMWSLRPCTTCHSPPHQPALPEPLSVGPGLACPWMHWAFHLSVPLLMQLPLAGVPISLVTQLWGNAASSQMHQAECIFPSALLQRLWWALHQPWSRTWTSPQKPGRLAWWQ